MPRQNRVTPFGEIIAVPDRGMFMGNRGCLHDDQQRIVRSYRAMQRWIICVTSFKGRKRPLMQPGRYTELFFLDESTALAAGHRPCCECRRTEFQTFKRAWIAGNPQAGLTERCSIDDIDRRLHFERLSADGESASFAGSPDELPDGAFVTLKNDERPHLVWDGRVHRWTPAGYSDSEHLDRSMHIDVLTPQSTLNALTAGYVPVVHPTVSNRRAKPLS